MYLLIWINPVLVNIYSIFQNKCKAELLKKLEQQKLIEAEKKRIAQIRQQQLETEQFHFFEDQLKKQELARGQKTKNNSVTSEPADGNTSSVTHLNNSFPKIIANKSDASASQSPPISRALKPAATLSAVQSKKSHFFVVVYLSKLLHG